MWESETKNQQINTPYAAPTDALGADAASLQGYGLVRASQKNINVLCTPNNELPFNLENDWNEDGAWYNVTLKGSYLFYDENATYIALNKSSVDENDKNAFAFAFIGNPYKGYKIVNYAAGEGKILSSSTTMSGTEGGSTFPMLKNEATLPGDHNVYWIATKSSNATNGFYLHQKGYANNRMNSRDNKLAYWTGGADNGSTFLVTEGSIEKAGDTTAIEEIADGYNEQEQTIYDLQGRKIERIAAKGIYIINGKKTVVE